MITYITYLCQVLSRGPQKELIDYLEDMKHARAVPNSITFLVVMRYYANRGNIEKIKQIESQMRSLNIRPSHAHYTVLMQEMIRLKHWDAVDDAWECVLESVRNGSEGGKKGVGNLGWIYPEAATCVYLDSLGFRKDAVKLQTTFERIISRTVPAARDDSLQKGSTSGVYFVPENACNSYVEALLRCGAVETACSFVLKKMGTGPLVLVPPTPKTYLTVVGMLKHESGNERIINNFRDEFQGKWPRIFKYCK